MATTWAILHRNPDPGYLRGRTVWTEEERLLLYICDYLRISEHELQHLEVPDKTAGTSAAARHWGADSGPGLCGPSRLCPEPRTRRSNAPIGAYSGSTTRINWFPWYSH